MRDRGGLLVDRVVDPVPLLRGMFFYKLPSVASFAPKRRGA